MYSENKKEGQKTKFPKRLQPLQIKDTVNSSKFLTSELAE